MNINNIDIDMASLKGMRPTNEDKHVSYKNIDGTDKSKAQINYLAVFDGHGGKFVSNYLSKIMPLLLTDVRASVPFSKKYLINVYNYAQSLLINKYQHWATYCGSTCLQAIHHQKNGNQYMTILNSGDTRCVLCKDNKAIPITKDHKPNWPEEKRRIEQLGGKIVFDGFDWRIEDLSVSRAFGDLSACPYVTHMPDIYRFKLDKTDKFMVLACDGLWDVLSNQDVVNFILAMAYDKTTNTRNPRKVNVAKKLAEYAISQGSTDNVSIIIYYLR